jgi:hypothetical protein
MFSDLSHSARRDSMSPVVGNFFESCVRACVRRDSPAQRAVLIPAVAVGHSASV